jgi:serine/threonine protein kinase
MCIPTRNLGANQPFPCDVNKMGDTVIVNMPPDSAPVLPLPPSERYQLIKSLGAGAFGKVYLAWDRVAARQVAVKLMPKRHARHVQQEVRMLQRASGGCAQHHVVCYLDSYATTHRGAPYLAVVTEYVRGRTLEQFTNATGAQLARWTVQLFRALRYLHRMGIVHRDIKPANVMVRGDDSLVLVDLGIGCGPCPTELYGVDGSPPFMWPPLLAAMERAARGEPVTVTLEALKAGDYYSAALTIALVALAGRVDAEDHTAASLLRAVLGAGTLVPRRPRLNTFLRTVLEHPEGNSRIVD